ncbi:MAG: sugar phosphate isomerase/epimerase, partial [Verrucomicrobiota bacterium]
MMLMGIGDEAGASLDSQLAATRELGWNFIEMRAVEMPGHAKANFHEIPDAAFDAAVKQLETANIQVFCFGSAVMNWAKKVGDPFDITLGEVKRCLPRMRRVRAKFVRIMSFKPGDDEFKTPPEVFRRVRDVTNMFLDAGLQPVHENC